MPVSNAYRTVNIKPVTGLLDMRSEPDQVPFGSARRRINWEITDSGKPGRVRGFQKLLPDVSPYNNQDLHDQLLSLQEYYPELAVPDVNAPLVTTYPPFINEPAIATLCGTTKAVRTTGRQRVTMLTELVSSEGQRKLMAGTQNRLYVLEESIGNWKIVSDAYGGIPSSGALPERRWKPPAQVGNVSLLTNGFDPPVYYQFDGVTSGCAMQAVFPLPDLDLIQLSCARASFAWRGVVFLGDVTMDGNRYENRVIWSDKDNPTSWDPATDGTITDYQDLDYGERIVGFSALHNSLLVFTTRGIWQITVSGDFSTVEASAFAFQKLYAEAASGEACVAYPNTICTDGTSVYYLGVDDIYEFNLYMSVPQKTLWLHAASSIIFDGISGSVLPIDSSICDSHIGWYDPRSQSIGFSWVQQGQTLPLRSLILQTTYKFASELDFGITAGCSFTSSPSVNFRDWIISKCACSAAAIDALITPSLKTGGRCVAQVPPPECTSYPGELASLAPFYTNTALLLDNGVLAEDYNQPTSDVGSFCRTFGTDSINDLCRVCKNEQLFVFAHATDYCLKQIGPEIGVREITTAITACGKWSDTGYEDKILFGPLYFDLPDEEKNMRKLELDFSATYQITPGQLNLRIGYSPNALDPNSASDKCAIVWRSLASKPLSCPSGSSAADHLTDGTSPNQTLHWSFYYTGRMLYVELSHTGTGGAYNVSRIGMETRALPRSTTS